MKKLVLILLFLLIIFLITLVRVANKYVLKDIKEGDMKLTTIFADGEHIPSEYTCDGADLAPELMISGVPESAKSLALIVDDPDAPMGTWVHWVLYNIPARTAVIDAKNLPSDTKEGITDFGRIGWGGPCPPSGTHRYFFKLYALDKVVDLPQGATKAQLEQAIKGHVIEKEEIIGLYKRVK